MLLYSNKCRRKRNDNSFSCFYVLYVFIFMFLCYANNILSTTDLEISVWDWNHQKSLQYSTTVYSTTISQKFVKENKIKWICDNRYHHTSNLSQFSSLLRAATPDCHDHFKKKHSCNSAIRDISWPPSLSVSLQNYLYIQHYPLILTSFLEHFFHISSFVLHFKKSLAIFPSPARISLTKLYLTGNNLFDLFYSVGIFPSISPFIGCTKNPRKWTHHWWLSEGVFEAKGGFLHWYFYARNFYSRIFLKDFLRKEIFQLANNIIIAACTNFQFTFLTTRQQTFMWQVFKMSVLWDSYFRSENCKQLRWEASLSLPYLHVFTYLLTCLQYLLTYLLIYLLT